VNSPDALTRLLDATERVIAEEGWAAATTRRVAERAGLTQGLVHYHARSMDELRRKATIGAIRRFFDQPIGSYELTPDDVRRWLVRLLSPDRASTAGRRELRVLHESLPAVGRDEALRGEVAELLGLYRESIAATLRDHGYAEATSAALAGTIAAAVDGAVLQHSIDPDFDVSPIADILTSAVISQGRL